MKIVRVDTRQPYIKDNTVYLPHDVMRPDGYVDARWSVLSNMPIIVVVRYVWADDTQVGDLGWVDKWMFFDVQEITWKQVQDKVAVVRQIREKPYQWHPNCVIPWDDDIETLVALEMS